jgi:hypothetical protein
MTSTKPSKFHAWPYILLWCAMTVAVLGVLQTLLAKRAAVPLGNEQEYNPVFYPLALLALSASTCLAAGLYVSKARGRDAVVKLLRGAARVIAVIVAFSLPVFIIATAVLLITQRMNSTFYELLVLYAGEAVLVAVMMHLSAVLAGSSFGREVAFLRGATVDDPDGRSASYTRMVDSRTERLKQEQTPNIKSERKVPEGFESVRPPSVRTPAAAHRSSRQASELGVGELLAPFRQALRDGPDALELRLSDPELMNVAEDPNDAPPWFPDVNPSDRKPLRRQERNDLFKDALVGNMGSSPLDSNGRPKLSALIESMDELLHATREWTEHDIDPGW